MSDSENSGEQRKKGKPRGRPFRPGESGNPKGRPADYGEFRRMCRERSPKALATLDAAMDEGGQVAVAAARVVIEYGHGKAPSAPEDLEAIKASSDKALTVLTREELLAIARGETP